ncbi:MAG: DUF2516 family protein [Bifidobacteriaceae bacterium]|jgi:hypothetical protein|nr:DUF2516 family protein [Bifidobacteriaceae bacterium]
MSFLRVQVVITLILSAAAFVTELWAFLSALKASAGAYALAGKLSKRAWCVITGASALVGFAALPTPVQTIGFAGILFIAALVAALVFLVSVRPKVRAGKPPAGNNRTGGW